MKLYCYEMAPIDFWWGALTAKQLLDTAEMQDVESLANRARFLAEIQSAAHLGFKKLGWEGDIREGPFFFAIPTEISMDLGYCLK